MYYNSHGNTDCTYLDINPLDRPLCCKGSVRNGDNVWIAEQVCIMLRVTIGDGAIIAANAVVTHDITAYVLAAGIPAKVIKMIK